MLKSKKVLILLVSLMVVVLGVAISLPVKATDSGTLPLDNLLAGLNSTDSNTTTNTTDTNITNTNTTNTTGTNTTNTNGTVIQPTTNRISNTTSGNDLPQTGVTEDITVMFFIIVCVIVAIYAYKKIRDYKS